MARFSDNQKIMLGKRIKFIRQSKGLDQEEFGKKIQPPAAASNVSRWERGLSVPNNKRISSIASLANVSNDFLLNGTRMSIKDTENFTKQILSKPHLTQEEKRKSREVLIEGKIAITNSINILNRPANEALKDDFFSNLSSSQQIFINDVIVFLNRTALNKQGNDLLSSISIFFNGLTTLIDGQIDKKEFKQYEHKLADTIDKLF